MAVLGWPSPDLLNAEHVLSLLSYLSASLSPNSSWYGLTESIIVSRSFILPFPLCQSGYQAQCYPGGLSVLPCEALNWKLETRSCGQLLMHNPRTLLVMKNMPHNLRREILVLEGDPKFAQEYMKIFNSECRLQFIPFYNESLLSRFSFLVIAQIPFWQPSP